MSIPREVYSTFCNNLYERRIWRSSNICICANAKDSIHTEHHTSLLLKEKLYIKLEKKGNKIQALGCCFWHNPVQYTTLNHDFHWGSVCKRRRELGFEEMLPPCGRLTQKQFENLLRGQYSKGRLGCKMPVLKFFSKYSKRNLYKGQSVTKTIWKGKYYWH